MEKFPDIPIILVSMWKPLSAYWNSLAGFQIMR